VKEAIGRNNLSPSLDFDTEGVIDIPVLQKDSEIHIPEIETNPTYDPFKDEKNYARSIQEKRYLETKYHGWEQLFEPVPDSEVVASRHLLVKNKYILSPVKSGVMIIDRRRAHERIIYERMLEAQANHQPLAQQTLFPESVRLASADYQICLEMIDELEKLGYDIRDFGNNTVVIHGFPTEAPPSKPGERIEMLIEQYHNLKGELEADKSERVARAASHASAMGFKNPLTESEMKELVDQLFACSNPNYTPTGKLIVKIIELAELDKYFKE
jgi:DNA mismatch repair protein MutL